MGAAASAGIANEGLAAAAEHPKLKLEKNTSGSKELRAAS
jgi:hypothetical protein